MATLGDLYRQARSLLQERQAASMQTKLPSPVLLDEINQLKRIMDLLLNAYVQGGGSKAERGPADD